MEESLANDKLDDVVKFSAERVKGQTCGVHAPAPVYMAARSLGAACTMDVHALCLVCLCVELYVHTLILFLLS